MRSAAVSGKRDVVHSDKAFDARHEDDPKAGGVASEETSTPIVAR